MALGQSKRRVRHRETQSFKCVSCVGEVEASVLLLLFYLILGAV